VLGVEDGLGGVGQQLREDALALGKPRHAQIEPVEIEQVNAQYSSRSLRPAARSA